jgi:hypothetical protein
MPWIESAALKIADRHQERDKDELTDLGSGLSIDPGKAAGEAPDEPQTNGKPNTECGCPNRDGAT